MRKIFDEYVPVYGRHNRIQTDHGTQFTSRIWLSKLKEEQIGSVVSSIRHPQSNLVERVNKEIGRFLRTIELPKHTAWPSWIPFIQSCLNEAYHDTTDFTPIELQTGQRPTRFWENYLLPPKRMNLPYVEKLALVYSHIKTKGEARADKLNASRSIKEYRIGDKVLVRACYFSNKASQVLEKFLSLYEGPYIVSAVYNKCTYKITYPNSNKIRGSLHSTEIRPYYEKKEDDPVGQEEVVEANRLSH